MKTVRLTMAQALIRYLVAQKTIIERHETMRGTAEEVPMVTGIFVIFGHGNVTCHVAISFAKAKMAAPDRDFIVMLGDGAYLMMHSDISSSVLTGHKLIVVVMENGGFAVINRLQSFKGSKSFNNLIADSCIEKLVDIDFAKHTESMDAIAETVHSLGALENASQRAKKADRTSVIVIKVQAPQLMSGDAWWDIGVSEVSARKQVCAARAEHDNGESKQRVGI